MADLGGTFDSGSYDDMNSGFDPIPAGEYLAKIVESDFVPTKDKKGKYVKLKFEIIQGEFKGRFIWTNINLVNKNPIAVDIAQKEFATLCRAVGKAAPKNTDELHGIPFKMKVKIKPAKGDYPAGNSPVNYSPAGLVGNSTPSKTKAKTEVTGGFGDEEEEKVEDVEEKVETEVETDTEVPWE